MSKNENVAYSAPNKKMDGDTSYTNNKSIFEIATDYLDAGLSVIPIRNECKIPAVKWKHLQKRLPTQAELYKWFNTWGYTHQSAR